MRVLLIVHLSRVHIFDRSGLGATRDPQAGGRSRITIFLLLLELLAALLVGLLQAM